MTVLLGPNGAGKSTLVACLLGDQVPDSGEVEVLGGRPAKRGSPQRRIGWLPQDPQLPQRFRVAEMVTYAGWLKGLDWSDARTAGIAALERVDLVDRSASLVKELSGGMRRRAAIAAATVHEPEVLLLDEPMAGLDPQQRIAVRDVIARYADTATVLMCTHILQDVVAVANRVVVVDHGVVRFDGATEAFTALSGRTGDLEAAYLSLFDVRTSA
ncbi:ATP-binding cassette domain-containing protein [Microlunatus elymi]|uniref:ATP-binding cassette domain-containing protein n=1 Tax=Microlunatus elymi TaxID=2596828 RepID=UPI00143DBA76|nr:ATP-binding cassette domain-containing protein [Microlunatus elymi]